MYFKTNLHNSSFIPDFQRFDFNKGITQAVKEMDGTRETLHCYFTLKRQWERKIKYVILTRKQHGQISNGSYQYWEYFLFI